MFLASIAFPVLGTARSAAPRPNARRRQREQADSEQSAPADADARAIHRWVEKQLSDISAAADELRAQATLQTSPQRHDGLWSWTRVDCDAATSADRNAAIQPGPDRGAPLAAADSALVAAFALWLTDAAGDDHDASGGRVGRAALLMQVMLGAPPRTLARATPAQLVDAVVGSVFAVVDGKGGAPLLPLPEEIG